MPSHDSESLQLSTFDLVYFSASYMKAINDVLPTGTALFAHIHQRCFFPDATGLLCDGNLFLPHHLLPIAPLQFEGKELKIYRASLLLFKRPWPRSLHTSFNIKDHGCPPTQLILVFMVPAFPLRAQQPISALIQIGSTPHAHKEECENGNFIRRNTVQVTEMRRTRKSEKSDTYERRSICILRHSCKENSRLHW